LQAQIAALGLEPFLRGMRAAALAARADRNGGDAQRHGNVGVGGSAVQVGAARGGATPGGERGGGGGGGGGGGAGRGADLANLHRHLAAGGALILDFQRALDGGGEPIHQLIHLLVTLRADVHFGARQRRGGGHA